MHISNKVIENIWLIWAPVQYIFLWKTNIKRKLLRNSPLVKTSLEQKCLYTNTELGDFYHEKLFTLIHSKTKTATVNENMFLIH